MNGVWNFLKLRTSYSCASWKNQIRKMTSLRALVSERVENVNNRGNMRRVGVTIHITVIAFWLLALFWRVKSVNSHRDQVGRGRHPSNCRRF